ncbi:MAG: 1-deoxy-D-xylulose-5-phosphate synthase [Elusimicrobiaceae bacterium]|nr:1-deoxy-D-xylulose-5-phosphate synthase [Elusimicrobiaceae bacterium]MBT4403130.1 1-deoxy-D-xylulose-5-phosphate synthase [Elusimicrobiaceae bacterium]MBT6715863.1 1-deoxy-D-xylulose-5-phosphate synthase [Elusimicrobiaceae bacterium]
MSFLEKIKSPKDLKKLETSQLPQLSKEIRQYIIETVSKNGGHLGSSLGATDFIVALHYIFNAPKDKFVFDTGHQAYAHKLLTGRIKEFKNLRQLGGISGFPKISESEYDTFGVGHASTALSAALGMAVARDQKGENNKVIAVVSDGCLSGGMSYEALQNAGHLKKDLLVILNDNQMFISKRVGALGNFLTKVISRKYVRHAERTAEEILNRFDTLGKSAIKVAKRAKVLFFPGMVFEEMGFEYFGPVNGHDTEALLEVLTNIKDMKRPVLLHLITQKGKGYEPAEQKPTSYHGLGIFDVETGESIGKKGDISFTKSFSDSIVKLAEKDKKITAITAAMPEGTGLDKFRDTYPERYYDVGIAEEHAVTFAGGLAKEGLKPVVALYSSFMQRGYDQLIHDICLQNLPVVFALDRAGVVGEDGPTHHGVFDLSFMRHIPNLTIFAPADEAELAHGLKTAFDSNTPFAIRYPRGAGFGMKMPKKFEDFKSLPIGKGVWLKKGKDANIIAIGNRVIPSLEACKLLAKKGIDCGVINARFVKPLDTKLISEAVKFCDKIITVEDNALQGGFGSAVQEYLSDNNINHKILRLGIADNFIEHGKQAQLYDIIGISEQKIAENVEKFL